MNRQNESVRLELLVLEVGRLRIGGIHREGVHLRKVDRQRAGSGVDAARRILIALFRGRGRVGIRAVLEELIAAVRFRDRITGCVLDRYNRGRGVLRDREADPRGSVLIQRDGNRRKRRAVVRLLLGNCERIAVLCLVARAGDRVGIRACRERDRLLRARAGIGRLAALQDGERRRRRGNMEGLRSGRNFPCKRGIAARFRHEAVAKERRKGRFLHFRVGLERAVRSLDVAQLLGNACQRVAVRGIRARAAADKRVSGVRTGAVFFNCACRVAVLNRNLTCYALCFAAVVAHDTGIVVKAGDLSLVVAIDDLVRRILCNADDAADLVTAAGNITEVGTALNGQCVCAARTAADNAADRARARNICGIHAVDDFDLTVCRVGHTGNTGEIACAGHRTGNLQVLNGRGAVHNAKRAAGHAA